MTILKPNYKALSQCRRALESKKIALTSIAHATLLITGGTLMASPVVAQDQEYIEEIVTIGTQIKGASIEGATPVTVVDAEQFDISGVTTGDELLRSIPQIGTIGFGNSRAASVGVNTARGDVSSFNLRSVGEGNTLVLVNGRRLVQHPISQTSTFDTGVPIVSANANTLPIAGLQRVEVLRDGAAALYGADAVAGVINYQLRDDYEGGELSVRYGAEDGTGRENIDLNGAFGFNFNEGRTSVIISGSYSDRAGVNSNENDFSSIQDFRGSVPSQFANDLSLDNRAADAVFAVADFDGLGTFRVRPTNLTTDSGGQLGVADCGGNGIDGSLTTFDSGGQSLCLDSSSQDRALRANRNEDRTLVPDVDRLNIFSKITHELNNGAEVYGEIAYYESTVEREREPGNLFTNDRFFVPADYFFNPFGPVTFADGRVNPNRLPGLDPSIVPVEGLGFELDEFRPTDVGNRLTTVDGDSFRFLAGIKGEWGEWGYDSAIVYSEAEVVDSTSNRISTPLFQQQLFLDTPDAFNIFSGFNPDDPTSLFDATPNPQSSIDPFLTTVVREAESSLTLVDLRVSNPSLFSLPGGEAAFGVGVEYREEDLVEDNSSNLDGSNPFIDPLNPNDVNGNFSNGSAVIASSPRVDFGGERDVLSVYSELILPILRDLPGANSLDLQFAVRYEDFSDFGDITTPKFGFSWYPINWLQFRGSFSEGFRAPNLVQTNNPQSSVFTAVDDFAAGIALGVGDINDSPINASITEIRGGNPSLQPEESDNISLGLVITPLDNLTLTLDYWEIETDGTVGTFDGDNQSRLDAVLRAQGSFNPNVIRAAPSAANPIGEIIQIDTIFENLNSRTASGFDLAALYNFDTSVGNFDLQLNVAFLDEFEQELGDDLGVLVAAGADPDVLGAAGDVVGLEEFPEFRATGSINWASSNDLWGASVFVRYIGDVDEPAVTSASGDVFSIDSQTRFDLSLVRREILGTNSSLRLTVNNVSDEEPPLSDDAFGFNGALHSSRGRFVSLTFKTSFNSL